MILSDELRFATLSDFYSEEAPKPEAGNPPLGIDRYCHIEGAIAERRGGCGRNADLESRSLILQNWRLHIQGRNSNWYIIEYLGEHRAYWLDQVEPASFEGESELQGHFHRNPKTHLLC